MVRTLTPSIRAASGLLRASASGSRSRTDTSVAIVFPLCSTGDCQLFTPPLGAVGVLSRQNKFREGSWMRPSGLILCCRKRIARRYRTIGEHVPAIFTIPSGADFRLLPLGFANATRLGVMHLIRQLTSGLGGLQLSGNRVYQALTVSL
jgi:hypothetical protein